MTERERLIEIDFLKVLERERNRDTETQRGRESETEKKEEYQNMTLNLMINHHLDKYNSKETKLDAVRWGPCQREKNREKSSV